MNGINATYLFERDKIVGQGRGRKVRNSEGYWTSLFAMLVLYLSRTKRCQTIPMVEYHEDEVGWRYEESRSSLNIEDLTYDTVLVEPNIGSIVGSNLRPDILIMYPEKKLYILIENKTIGTDIGNQINEYRGLIRAVSEASSPLKGWQGKIVLLISLGYENDKDFRRVARENPDLPIILWEDVLKIIDELDLPFKLLFDFDLSDYYKDVPRQGRWNE